MTLSPHHTIPNHPLNRFRVTRQWLLASVVCVVTSGSLWAVPAPTLNGPLYSCSTRVYVQSFNTGAELRVYVNGGNTPDGVYVGAWGVGEWVDLDQPLDEGDAVTVTQFVGNSESSPSPDVFVAEPNPPPLAYFELPVERCAEGAHVHNKIAGDIEIRTDANINEILAKEDDNEGDFRTILSRPLGNNDNTIDRSEEQL